MLTRCVLGDAAVAAVCGTLLLQETQPPLVWRHDICMYARLWMRAGLAESAGPALLPLPAAKPVCEGLSDIDCFCVAFWADTCRCYMVADAGATGETGPQAES